MKSSRSVTLRLLVCLAIACASFSLTAAELLKLTLQKRVESKENTNEYRVVTVPESWNPQKTAIIVCDMWDLHHCKNAVRREAEMAPREKKDNCPAQWDPCRSL